MNSQASDFRLESTYLSLPNDFYQRVEAAEVETPSVVIWNAALAESLGLGIEDPTSQRVADWMSGQETFPGSTPFAQAYAGHQFGHFTMLGDGRAVVLGEAVDATGQRFDLQLKGSGRTRFSRGGDGLAALGPMLREYIMSEAMAGLGIPTTRSLAVTATGRPVYRERPLPGAILCRVARAHLRVGTFQFAAATGEPANVAALLDYSIERLAPHCRDGDSPPLDFLRHVIRTQAELVADWMAVGFVHGVMNTDNTSLSGETIDYGPCAMMEAYDPATVFSSIDSQGRYAYQNQPEILLWNLCRFAETLLPLIDENAEAAIETTTETLQSFETEYELAWRSRLRQKFGLPPDDASADATTDQALAWLASERLDWTNFFRDLSEDSFPDGSAIAEQPWYRAWISRLENQPGGPSASRESMRAINPSVIPRNTIVENVLSAAEDGNLEPLSDLLTVLGDPYADRPDDDPYREARPAALPAYRTFCGT